MEKPFFSIITPNYNSGNKLLRAIKSLEKNKTIYEHIIIDDVSTDDSFCQAEILENEQNKKTYFFKNPCNSGPGVSRNKGLEYAKGEYILFLDADDYFVDGALDYLYSIIQAENRPSVLVFDHYLKSNNSVSFVSTLSNEIEPLENPISEYLLDKIISSPWGKCIKADLAKSFYFPNLRVAEDSIFNLDIFINAKRVIKVNSILYIFDKSDDNSLTRKSFSRKEFSKFHKGWIYFERKANRELTTKNKNELIASRKIKFCVLYYASRLIIDHDQKFDDFVIGSIRKIYLENKKDADVFLNFKIKLFCNVFFLFPKTTITLCRTLKFRF